MPIKFYRLLLNFRNYYYKSSLTIGCDHYFMTDSLFLVFMFS